jgi:hypothetical protein
MKKVTAFKTKLLCRAAKGQLEVYHHTQWLLANRIEVIDFAEMMCRAWECFDGPRLLDAYYCLIKRKCGCYRDVAGNRWMPNEDKLPKVCHQCAPFKGEGWIFQLMPGISATEFWNDCCDESSPYEASLYTFEHFGVEALVLEDKEYKIEVEFKDSQLSI